MKAIRLDQSILAVSDWAASNRFYRAIVGADIVEVPPVEAALQLYEQKGHLVGARRANAVLLRLETKE